MVFARGLRAARQLVPSARAARSMSAAASFGSSSSSSSALSSSARASRAPMAARLSTPAHVQGDVTAIVAGVAAVGAIIGVGKMWWDASSDSSAGYAPVASFQELSQRDIATFFKELTAEVQNLFKQLPEIENAVRTYMANNNITLGDAEFQQAMLQQLFQMMEALEAQVVGKRGWSRESLEHALEKFAMDPEIVRLQEELNALMQTVFPKPEPVDIPDSLTPEKTIEILAELVKGMEKAMRDMLSHARAEGITDPAKAMEEFQYLYLEHVEQLTTAQMKLHGVSQQAFTAALSKYHSESEQFRQQIEKIYQEQAKVFKKMGLEVESP